MRIIFFGSDDFAEVHLEKLSHSQNEIVAVVTQPDRPKGRGMQVGMSPIKEWAWQRDVPVLQPERLTEPWVAGKLKPFFPDLFVVIAYGQLLPAEVLSIPKACSINVHASLLPRYRGAAPINWAIIHGEKESGISIIKLNASLDAGDIMAQVKVPIDSADTSVTLRSKLAQTGSELLCQTVADLEKGKCQFKAQDDGQATHAPKLKKSHGLIDWNKKAIEIHNLVRGLLPWPSAHTFFNGKALKVIETAVVATKVIGHKPGEVLGVSADGIVVATGHDGLLLQQVHPESSKQMSASSFAAGYKILQGFQFGIPLK